MKRVVVLIICLLLFGCNEAKEVPTLDTNYNFNYNDKYYHVYTPYKAGVGENYFLTDSFNSYNVNEIERGLLDLSSEHFSVDGYYYQEGQHLKRKDLESLLSKDNLNSAAPLSVDGTTIQPTYIVGIYEENFLDDSGKIKGMSIGLALNRHQVYRNGNGVLAYYTVSEEVVIAHAKAKSDDLISFIRKNEELKNIDILVGIYIESSPNSTVPGNYKQYGITNSDKIDWQPINQSKFYLNSSQAKQMDLESYNNYQIMESKIKNSLPNLYIAGMGYYQSEKLVRAEIRITRSFYRYGELLYLTNVVSENIIKYLDNVDVTVEFRENNDVKAYILKSKGKQSTDIFVY